VRYSIRLCVNEIMRTLSLLFLMFLGSTQSFAADQFNKMLERQAAIDKFVHEAPLFIKDKSLSSLRKLAPLKFEGVDKIPNSHVPGENLEYKTLEFDGLSIFGLVKKQRELSLNHIIVTDEKWKILEGLNVGINVNRVAQVLGKPTYEYDNIKEYCGETECVRFFAKETKIIKVDFIYYSD